MFGSGPRRIGTVQKLGAGRVQSIVHGGLERRRRGTTVKRSFTKFFFLALRPQAFEDNLDVYD